MKQQQVAMRLAKAAGGGAGGDRYMWWAVASLLLQARAATKGMLNVLPRPRITEPVCPDW